MQGEGVYKKQTRQLENQRLPGINGAKIVNITVNFQIFGELLR
jgi:hypothetical protein